MAKRTNQRVPIHETHEIPSRGILYGEGVPSQITLRAMDALDEKKRLAGNGMSTIADVINGCIVGDESIDVKNFVLADVEFLMYKLRIETYGPDYKLNVMCQNPKCGHIHEHTINLDELDIRYIDDDFIYPFTLPALPKSKDVITAKIMTVNDYTNMEGRASKILNKFPDYIGDPEYILKPEYRIVEVNGEVIPSYKIQKYIESMHMMDRRFFECKYDDAINGFGLDTSVVLKCPDCGEDIFINLPVTDEFFRPTY